MVSMCTLKRDILLLQIHVIKLQLLQARPQGIGDVGDVGDDFRGHEQLFSRGSRFFDCSTEFGLSLVDFSAILMVVSQLDGGLGGINALLVEL